MGLLYPGPPLLLGVFLFASVSGHVANKALANELLNATTQWSHLPENKLTNTSAQWSPLPESNRSTGVDLWLDSESTEPAALGSEEIDTRRQQGIVPDEQRLYENLMTGYESSVRPVINASRTIVVSFKLTLNQIIDLDERKQVLTTNVFIDQEWEDENLKWNADHYNGIRTLRVPASYVWLPDTFIFNNADDGSTGFMQGVYVSLNFTGMVLWPVPVKLKSSCKVDITYFPFDDQKCILRFGSWIYSGEWMDFKSSIEDVDLSYYIDNSEWELLSITFQKGVRKYACCPEPHPDLTYTLHIRRRTFFYIFNIIVPCVMLSVLTLLTFWLPTTCGEKISLGLSVFLAFSMFMLLIAEEVPAASESVPLIGIYLTTVMTMTSLSVVMAVLVINIYNRGSKARRAPRWIKVVVLNWMCRFLRMTHDIERLAATIQLTNEEEERYDCAAHNCQKQQAGAGAGAGAGAEAGAGPGAGAGAGCRSGAGAGMGGTHDPERRDPLRHMAGTPSSPPVTLSPSDSDLDDLSKRFTRMAYRGHGLTSSPREALLVHRSRNGTGPSVSGLQNVAMATDSADGPDCRAGSAGKGGKSSGGVVVADEPVWLPRDLSDESGEQLRFRVHNDTDQAAASVSAQPQQQKTQRPSCLSSVAALLAGNQTGTSSGGAIEAVCGGAAMLSPSTEDVANLDSVAPSSAELLNLRMHRKQTTLSNLVADSCQREKALISRKQMIVEWQTIATVIDRLLFWIFLLGTIVAYIVILIVVPGSKPTYSDTILPIHLLKRNS